MPELFVTNFNRNYTGVSATAAGVLRQQIKTHDAALIGHPLPGAPAPITRKQAHRLSKNPPLSRPFSIWHVRRDPEMIAALWARDVLRLPIKIVFTSAAQRFHSAIPRWLISRMDAVIATTDRAAEFVPNVWGVAPHGVDYTQFSPAPDRAAAWANTGFPGRRGIATIGRIRPEKGTDIFIDTVLRILPDRPDVTALVIGKAKKEHQSFLATLKSRIAQANLTDRVLFPGELPPDDMARLLPALDLVVQMPRYEGYGMVPLESFASAVPLLASDTGYYRHFSQNGQNGLIVGADPSEAAAALSALLDTPERLAAMAAHARRDAETIFSIDKEAAGINEVYDRLWAAG